MVNGMQSPSGPHCLWDDVKVPDKIFLALPPRGPAPLPCTPAKLTSHTCPTSTPGFLSLGTTDMWARSQRYFLVRASQ